MKIIGRQKSLKDSTVKFIIELDDRERKRKAIVYEKVFYQRNVDLEIDPECYECTSHCLNTSGYPSIYREGKVQSLSRYLYTYEKGENPEVVMHLCDNRKCINIHHLTGGTVSDNNKDRMVKGRSSKGELHPKCKLTDEEVSIVKRLLLNGFSYRRIAKAFNVKKTLVGYISNGKRRKEIEPCGQFNREVYLQHNQRR